MKQFMALVLVVVMILSFSACGGDQLTEKNLNSSSTQVEKDDDNSNTKDDDVYSEQETTVIKSEGNTVDDTDSDSFAELSVNTIAGLEEIIEADMENTASKLNTEWETLSATVTTYDDYVKNAKKVEDFYNKIDTQVEQACIRLQEYTVKYAEMIMANDMNNYDKYDAFGDLLDCIYDDASGVISDDIYDDLLGDMIDVLYDDALGDSDEAESYSEWSDIRSDEYNNWSDTRSKVYDNWSDTRSDVYDLFSDMRSELWDDDTEQAQETLTDYKEDVAKLKKD